MPTGTEIGLRGDSVDSTAEFNLTTDNGDGATLQTILTFGSTLAHSIPTSGSGTPLSRMVEVSRDHPGRAYCWICGRGPNSTSVNDETYGVVIRAMSGLIGLSAGPAAERILRHRVRPPEVLVRDV